MKESTLEELRLIMKVKALVAENNKEEIENLKATLEAM